MAVKLLPRDDDGDRSTVIGLLYGLIEGSTNGWSVIPIVSIVVGILFFAAFAYRQRTAPTRSSRPRS